MLAKRTLQPAGLVSVGSDVVNTPPHDGHSKQAAIWETGMDSTPRPSFSRARAFVSVVLLTAASRADSPMYDQVTWNASVDKMLIYDVGMTGEFLGETEALADLAAVLNMTEDVALLKARQADMAAKVQKGLWSEATQIYLNYQEDTKTFNTHTSPTSFYPMLSGTATVEQALAMTKRWLTNHSGYCLGNHSGSAAPPPPPDSSEPRLTNWWSSSLSDNAICVRGGPDCGATVQAETGGADAKHRSAAHTGDCCPNPMHKKDGLAPETYGSYRYVREEAHGDYLLPSEAELSAHGPTHGTVQLRMFYSARNADNYLGTNASAGYEEVRARSLGSATNLSAVAATIFAKPPNSSYVPMDLFWSAGRKDFQNVASAASRHWLVTKGPGAYVHVQRLGYVLSSDALPQSGGLMGPCKFSLPSTPNNDPAYKDNSYWRGRVWGPLNLLVYMGLRHPKYADVPEIQAARKQLAVQSREALMVEWLPKHHVHENLNPDTGLGDDVGNSNPMYHWGACLAFIEMWETGKF